MAKTLYRFSIVVVTTILSVGIGKYLSDTLSIDIYMSQFCSTLVMTSMAVFFIIRDIARYRVFNITLGADTGGDKIPPEEQGVEEEQIQKTPTVKKPMSEETRRKISEKAKIREQKKREQKARFEKTQKESAVRKAKRATAKK